MSKIFDALRKSAEGDGEERGNPAPREVPPVTEPAEASLEASEPAPPPVVTKSAPSAPPVAADPDEGAASAWAGDLPAIPEEFARELSSLRASLEQLMPGQAQKTLLFTGSVPGEGSSTVAARFAQLLGDDPKLRVALVDTDLRNADPRPVETVNPGSGFASVLTGSLSAAHAFRNTAVPDLHVLPSEGVHGDPYAILTEEHVDPFLNYLRGQYHYALLDAAPVLSAPETARLAASVDGVVLVVRAGRTKREIIQQSLDRLGKHGARVLGVVMNRQQYVIPQFIYRRL